jgi:tRNA-Thr(GGU) m(6)t(6)A37 methyltransferase TsaA
MGVGRVDHELRPVGHVESALVDPADAPRQPDEGAGDAWLVFDDENVPALEGLRAGDDVLLLTWLHRADRTTLAVHPSGDLDRPLTGVFATRSPDRPNPIGLHTIHIMSIDGARVHVRELEALDGTPILDVKPILTGER